MTRQSNFGGRPAGSFRRPKKKTALHAAIARAELVVCLGCLLPALALSSWTASAQTVAVFNALAQEERGPISSVSPVPEKAADPPDHQPAPAIAVGAGSGAQPAGASPASPVPEPVPSAYDEVHIRPQVAPEKPNAGVRDPVQPKSAEVSSSDPSLKTYSQPFKVDVDLVLVPVTITDPANRLVVGLEKENFIVLDNGQRQAIKHFSSEDMPVSLGVIFDMSGSMQDKLGSARAAIVEFFKTSNPEDEFFLIAFNDQPAILADFTRSVEEIQGKLDFAKAKGRTALLDAIYLGLAKMRQAKYQRKALLIISDGGDNHSRYTENEIKSMVREADVQIYALGLFSPNPLTIEEREGPFLLAGISEVTGGRSFTINSPSELTAAATKIGIELRNQYVLGYLPKNSAHDGKWRRIKVRLQPPKGLPPLTVYAKTGYYAPSE